MRAPIFFCLTLMLSASQVFAAGPKTEFGKIQAAYATFKNQFDGLACKNKTLDPKPILVSQSASQFLVPVATYSMKTVKRDYILKPLSALITQLNRYAASKNEKSRKLLRAQIRHQHRYFDGFPVLIVLEAQSKAHLGADKLSQGQFAGAEDLFLDAKALLEAASITRSAKAEINKATTGFDMALLAARREEPVSKALANSMIAKIEVSLLQASLAVQSQP
jgi:hypothetical protein